MPWAAQVPASGDRHRTAAAGERQLSPRRAENMAGMVQRHVGVRTRVLGEQPGAIPQHDLGQLGGVPVASTGPVKPCLASAGRYPQWSR
jgi:hypothetical protein